MTQKLHNKRPYYAFWISKRRNYVKKITIGGGYNKSPVHKHLWFVFVYFECITLTFLKVDHVSGFDIPGSATVLDLKTTDFDHVSLITKMPNSH